MIFRDVLIFLAGSSFGSFVTVAAIAHCMMAKEGDRQLDAQQEWRNDVRRLLGESTCQNRG